MSPEQATNWVPGLVVLGAGAAGAVAYLLGSRRLRAEVPVPDSLDDLEARYQSLLEELRTHVANRHLVPAELFAREKVRLEKDAAEALRARDGRRHEALKAEARAEQLASVPVNARASALRGALMGGALVAFFVVIGWQLSRPEAAPAPSRPQRPPPPEAMVQPLPTESPLVGAGEPTFLALQQRAAAAPRDVQAQGDLLVRLLILQRFDEVRPVLARAAAVNPADARVKVAEAVLRAVDNDPKPVLGELEQLASADPAAFSANLFAALICLDLRDSPRALRNLERYLAQAPEIARAPLLREQADILRTASP